MHFINAFFNFFYQCLMIRPCSGGYVQLRRIFNRNVVAGLLAVTIGYCVILNARLKKMRADEETMRSIIMELVKSTETAERAILGLRATASECNKTISARLNEAREVAAHLDQGVARGRHAVRQQAPQMPAQMAVPQPTPVQMHAQPNAQPAYPQTVRTHPQPRPHPDYAGVQHMQNTMQQTAQAMRAQPMAPPPPGNDPRYVHVPAQPQQPAAGVHASPSTANASNDLEARFAELTRRSQSGAVA